jgi:1,4-alpha-glucan branching enzyme
MTTGGSAPERIRPPSMVGASLRSRKKRPMPPVRFRFRQRAASTVAVAGDFNRRSTAAHPLKRATDDLWVLEVDLPPGRHEHKFFVDGREWWNDGDRSSWPWMPGM